MSEKRFDFNLLIGPLGIVFLILFYLVFGVEVTFFFTLVSGTLIWFINWKTDRDLDQYKREARKEDIKSFERNQKEEKKRVEESREEARLRAVWNKFREEEKNNEREKNVERKSNFYYLHFLQNAFHLLNPNIQHRKYVVLGIKISYFGLNQAGF